MIELDLSDMISEADLALIDGTRIVEAVLDDLSAAARARWIRAAQTELRSTAQDYIAGISEVEAGDGVRVITLEGWLPNAIESGIGPWDLRDTVLGPDAKVKVSASGSRYRSVPFRHGTPGTTGLAGTPMGLRYGPQPDQSLAFASARYLDHSAAAELGQTLYKRAKALRDRKKKSGKIKRGTLPAGVGGVGLLAPWHTTDIYAGMRRVRKTYVNASGKQTTQSQYMTWRTISTANPTGWIHPGIEARHFLGQVERHVQDIAGELFQQALGGGQ